MVVQITTAFLPVPQAQSALCPGASCLHLLYALDGSEAGTGVSTMQRQRHCHLNHLAWRGGEQL
jgi:hypothetical protein